MSIRPVLPGNISNFNPFRHRRQRTISYNPATSDSVRPEPAEVKITVYDFNPADCQILQPTKIEDTFPYRDSPTISWVNIDGLRREDIRKFCDHFGIHFLLADDILSVGQRAKMDEIGDYLFALLPMLYFNPQTHAVEAEQVSIILGKNIVVSFQDDPSRDVFGPVRDKLHIPNSKLRNGTPDLLVYALLDAIVDSYFHVMDKLAERIEFMEDIVQRDASKRTLGRINFLRHEMLTFRRAIAPVREVINGFLKSDSDLLNEHTEKFFKDIYDHIIQANDMAENYREMVLNLQEMYITQVNLKMNEVMKVLAVVTTLIAPPTLLAGIYGMNFKNMPELETQNGYYIVLGVMAFIFIGMIVVFKKRGWF
ncbi:magnesium and cobalt transport protein CorA [Chitinophaga parva]|uniref:Magnesium transport protein CorA n=1 Tax=Chitinophaga parva TaxID=2169414 RepID=A0A2T7BL53_9BACT|nr:magnesium/cobalt transporter CorA [Chitinophaga parva]PUZ28413.1 magnesium and cobalt transport protein CorA [Chitinophaga parva]